MDQNGNFYNPQPTGEKGTAYNGGAPSMGANPSDPVQNGTQGETPISIYNNTVQDGAPQYHYGMPCGCMDKQYIENQKEAYLRRKQTEKKIKALGTKAGIALLIVMALSYFFSFVLMSDRLYSLYETNLAFQCAFGIFYSVITVGGAFLIASRVFRTPKRVKENLYKAPADPLKTSLLVLMGFGGCIGANYITAYLRAIAENLGIYSSYSAIDDPKNGFEVLLVFISSAIIPPLVEEYAMRGVLLSSLRKYGNLFAVISSAFVFGIFHGNAVQMPFAFICGLFLGYAVIASDSLWTGVIIHALVNALAAGSSAIIYYFDEYAADTFYMAASFGGTVAAIIAVIIYYTKYNKEILLPSKCEGEDLPLKAKFANFVKSPIMIIAIVLFGVQALSELLNSSLGY